MGVTTGDGDWVAVAVGVGVAVNVGDASNVRRGGSSAAAAGAVRNSRPTKAASAAHRISTVTTSMPHTPNAKKRSADSARCFRVTCAPVTSARAAALGA